MIIKKYIAEIVTIVEHKDEVYTLELKSMQGGRFRFVPGQFLHFSLEMYDPSAAWPESRCFSIQTSPGKETIQLTYAVKGVYTQRMKRSLKIGSQVSLKLPYGDLFTQDHLKNKTIFIAGGTGVTPYLSLFTDRSFAAYTEPVLYLGLRNASMNFYLQELELAKQINSGLQIHCVHQDEDGFINIQRVLDSADNLTSFFISGPPVMISSFKQHLLEKGVYEDCIKTDDWE